MFNRPLVSKFVPLSKFQSFITSRNLVAHTIYLASIKRLQTSPNRNHYYYPHNWWMAAAKWTTRETLINSRAEFRSSLIYRGADLALFYTPLVTVRQHRDEPKKKNVTR